jgi:hypothetical protein
MFTLISSSDHDLPFVDPAALKREYRSLRSSLWPLLSPSVFSAAQPLVTTRSRAYTAGDMAGFLGDIRMDDVLLLLHRARTRRERRVSYASAGGRVRRCAGRGRATKWMEQRSSIATKVVAASAGGEGTGGRSGDGCGERGEGGKGGCRAVAKLALAIRRGSSLFFSSLSLLLPCFFSKMEGGARGRASWKNQRYGGLSPGRPTVGFATGAAARSRLPERREKRGFSPLSDGRPTVGNSLSDATLESVGPTGTRGRVEKVSVRKKFRFGRNAL